LSVLAKTPKWCKTSRKKISGRHSSEEKGVTAKNLKKAGTKREPEGGVRSRTQEARTQTVGKKNKKGVLKEYEGTRGGSGANGRFRENPAPEEKKKGDKQERAKKEGILERL